MPIVEYEALDLSAAANAGDQAFGGAPRPERGAREGHGLPFALGTAGAPAERWLVALGPGGHDAPVAVDVGRQVRWLVFAHVLVDASREAPATLGREAARYELRLAGGASETAVIRDRFEIA